MLAATAIPTMRVAELAMALRMRTPMRRRLGGYGPDSAADSEQAGDDAGWQADDNAQECPAAWHGAPVDEVGGASAGEQGLVDIDERDQFEESAEDSPEDGGVVTYEGPTPPGRPG